MILAALLLAQAVPLIAGNERVQALPPNFPFTSNAGIDLGCLGGLAGSRYPAQVYDRAHNERITYNVSRCTGGYIHATNEATSKSWSVQIRPGGQIDGRDLNGDKWRYDRPRAVYVNLKTHAECAHADYRAMCAAPSA